MHFSKAERARFFDVVSSTIVHLSSAQEETHAVFQLLADSEYSQLRSASEYPPVTVYTYPRVPFDPPFPFKSKAPALLQAGETNSVDPYIRSATNLSYSRTLALLRRELGPHFDLEKLWERHTHYVRAFTLWKNRESQPTRMHYRSSSKETRPVSGPGHVAFVESSTHPQIVETMSTMVTRSSGLLHDGLLTFG